MNKLSKLFLLGALAVGIGFTSCSKEAHNDTPSKQLEGDTHLSISLKLGKGSSLNGLPNDYNEVGDWSGKDQITSITVFVSDASEVAWQKFEVGSGKAYEVVTGVVTPKTEAAAFKTKPGWKEVFVLVNSTPALDTHFGITGTSGTLSNVTEFKTKYAAALTLQNNVDSSTATNYTADTSASKLASTVDVAGVKHDAIAMTNLSSKTITVAPKVLKSETIDAVQKKNRVNLEVDRAVARVLVTQAKSTYDVPSVGGGSVLGTISELTWVVAQGENKLYVQRKADWKTPSFDFVPANENEFIAGAADKYDYSGLYESYNQNTGFGGTAVPATTLNGATNIGENSIANGKFILPNTHVQGKDATTSKFKKGNTAYVMFRAKFTPTTFADSDPVANTDKAGTFYLGANGKFYHTADAALDPAKGGVPDQTVAKYDGGKVIYYAWINPDVVTGNWFSSPVVRNNIYHIHITGFKTIGTNWNPLFPEDPNAPKDPSQGGNPDPKPNANGNYEEPENPIKPEDPLTTPETWLSVDVTVLPWKVHTYNVDLSI